MKVRNRYSFSTVCCHFAVGMGKLNSCLDEFTYLKEKKCNEKVLVSHQQNLVLH